MSKADRLRVTWSKRERDVMYHYPSRPDGAYAHYVLGHPLQEFLDEMERRGYDRSTFVLTIKRRPPASTTG